MSPFFRPLAVPRLDGALPPRMTAGQLAWVFVALGVAVRLVRYFLNMPLSMDECFVAENFLDRGYFDLLQPLSNVQVAPIGFLWIERAAVSRLGFAEWSLRLYPLCCGVAGLFLFRHLASRLLSGAAFVLAVACLAVAQAPTVLCTDVKPYSADLLVALVILTCLVEWLRDPDRTRWLWVLAALVPAAMLLSLPAVFVLGAVSLALVVPLLRLGRVQPLCAWLTLNSLLLAGFLVLWHFNLSSQDQSTRDFMEHYWTRSNGFPPLAEPWRLALWLADVHTGEDVFAYPYGSENGGSVLTLACCVTAGVVMYRNGQRAVLAAFVGGFVLLFAAASLKRYPYGGNIRLVQFLAPAVCVTAGLGAATLLARLPAGAARRQGMAVVLCALATLPVASAIRSVARPYRDFDDTTYRDFARSFWAPLPGVATVCARTDLGRTFCDSSRYSYPYAFYRCYQRLYSPAHRGESGPAGWPQDNLGQATRLIVYQPPRLTLDQGAVATWLEALRSAFDVTGPETLSIASRRNWDMYGTMQVYRLLPRSGTGARSERISRRDEPGQGERESRN